MAKAKIYTPRRTDGLWRGVVISGWIFIAMAAGLSAANVYRALLLGEMSPTDYMVEADFIPGHEGEFWTAGLLALGLLLAYVVGAVFVLCWYLRSIRNAHVLHRGIETTPGWVVWSFFVPVVSLFRPYAMTSELWRSSRQPDGWKALRDPAILRWWWGLLLGAGFASIGANIFSRAAENAQSLQQVAVVLALVYGAQAVAGLLFLSFGGDISRRQTELVVAGYRPPESTIPAWSA
ncbi:hypothetical protein BH09PSE1_BH09PSE1_25910 [soil metagenome]